MRLWDVLRFALISLYEALHRRCSGARQVPEDLCVHAEEVVAWIGRKISRIAGGGGDCHRRALAVRVGFVTVEAVDRP